MIYARIALYLALAAALFGSGYWTAHQQTIAARAECQVTLSTASATAQKQLAALTAAQLADEQQRDALKTQLETKYATDQKATDAHRRALATASLRITVPASAVAGMPAASGPSTSQPAAATTVELPAKTASDLRQLAYDADALADAYRKCWQDDTQGVSVADAAARLSVTVPDTATGGIDTTGTPGIGVAPSAATLVTVPEYVSDSSAVGTVADTEAPVD